MRTTYDNRRFMKILRYNNYRFDRQTGSHKIYENGTNTISVPKKLNKMIALRLIKENSLEVTI